MSTPITTPAQAFLLDSPEVQNAIHNDATVDGYWLPVSFVPEYKIKSIVWFEDKRYVKITNSANNSTNPSLNATDWMELDSYLKSTVLVDGCITTQLLSTTDLILPENTELSELDYFEDSLKPASTNLTKNALKKYICEDTTEGIKIVDLEIQVSYERLSSFELDTDGTFYYTNPNDDNRLYKKKYNEIGAGTPTTNVAGFCPRIIGNYLFFTDRSTLFLKRKNKNTIYDGVFFTNDFGANPVMIDSEYVAYIGAPGTDVDGARTRKKPILSDATYAPITICINRTNYLTGIKYISTSTLAFLNLTVPGYNIHFVRTDMSSSQTSAVYSLLAGIDVQFGFDFFGDYFIFSDNTDIWMLNLRTYADFPFKKKICSGGYPRIIDKNKLIYQKQDGIYLKNLFIL